MNAPLRTPIVEPSVELIPIDTLWPSNTKVQQLRRERFNDAAITELAASLLKAGQLQPILVRPQPAVMIEGRKYEIVLGERRFRAAERAGLKHIQATVREMDDAAVLEAQLIENLQREDLHPLEEAEGYAELMRAAGMDKEELGDRVGKSRSWVYARLQLLRLPAPARDALEGGRIDISRAQLLATIGDPVHQARALKLAVEKTWDGKSYRYSVRALKDEIGNKGFTISLKSAPFDVADRALTPGSCEGCEYRSANHDPEAEDPDVCTNRSCYEKKVKAHGARALKEAEEAGRQVLRGDAAKKIDAGRDRYVGFVDLDQPCDFDEFLEEEPEVPEGVEERDHPAWIAWNERSNAWQPRTYRQLLGAGPWPFETVLLEGKGKRVVELAPFDALQKLLKKTADIALPKHMASKPRAAAPSYDYAAERAKQEERRRKDEEIQKRERAWRIPVLKSIVAAKIKPELKGDELRILAEAFLDDWTVQQGLKIAGYGPPNLNKATDAQIIVGLRLAIACVDIVNTDDDKPTELLALAKAHKVDVEKIKKQVGAQPASTPKKRK